MKKLFIAVLASAVFLLSGCGDYGKTHYAQLSSSETQTGTATVTFDQVDGINGMAYSKEKGLTVNKMGAYFIVAAPQVVTGKGCYDLWLNVNGEPVANSNVRYCSDGDSQTDVIISQGAGCFKRGAIIALEQSGTGIEAIQPEGEPLVPSIIFTAYRIGDC